MRNQYSASVERYLALSTYTGDITLTGDANDGSYTFMHETWIIGKNLQAK